MVALQLAKIIVRTRKIRAFRTGTVAALEEMQKMMDHASRVKYYNSWRCLLEFIHPTPPYPAVVFSIISISVLALFAVNISYYTSALHD
jgi:hypothetical protein